MSAFSAGPMEPLRIRSGHAAIFELPAISSEPAPSVTWQAEDNALLYGTKYAVTQDNRLVVLAVEAADAKRYRSGH